MSDVTADRDPIEMLAESFLARFRRGERPSVEEYAAKYPELADEILELLPALVMLEQEKSVAGEATGTGGVADATAAGTAPQQLGDYLILREIGRGGMGVVYESVQQSLGRHVALKVLPHQALAGSSQLERFRLEARAAARLHHTNIVPVFGVGECDGVHYFAMQFIQGQGLDVVIDALRGLPSASGPVVEVGVDGPGTTGGGDRSLTTALTQALLTGRFAAPPAASRTEPTGVSDEAHQTPAAPSPQGPAVSAPARATDSPPSDVGHFSELSTGRAGAPYHRSVARVGVQVAEALAHAHGQGILHRDIKPSNLLLDAKGTVWVTDFGLAKAEGGDALTNTGDIIGTLRYMAPERFDGWSDPRSDVYALGATLYELLTLRPLFEESDRLKLIEQVLHESPASPRKLDRRIPQDLETIVLKALAKEPGSRYTTAEQMAEDLRRFVADRPILARRITSAERAWRWARRNKAIASLLALLAIVLLGGFAGMAVLLARAENSAAHAKNSARIETQARGQAQEQAKIAGDRAEELRRQDYVSRVNLSYRECLDNNIARAIELLDGCPQDLRGWEWQYAWRACHLAIWSVRESQQCHAVAFSPDGSQLATGMALLAPSGAGELNDMVVREVATGREMWSRRKVPGGFASVAFSPDGRLLAAGGSRDLTLWEADTGHRIHLMPDPGIFAVASVAFSPDGRRLISGHGHYDASGESRGYARLWDVATGQAIGAPIPGQDGGVWCVAFSPDGLQVALTATGLVEIWDLPGPGPPKLAHSLSGHKGWVYGVAFSPNGQYLASAGLDGTVRLWDRAKGKPRLPLVGHRGRVLGVAFSPDSESIASAGQDRSVKLWSVSSGRELASLPGHEQSVNHVAFSPDGRLLATGGSDRTIKLWAATPNTPLTFRGHEGVVDVVGFGAGGRAVLTRPVAYEDFRQARMWDAATGEPISALPSQADESSTIALGPDGRWLACAGGFQRTIQLFEMGSGGGPRLLEGHAQAISHLAFRPDGHRLASAGWDGTVKVWEVPTGRNLLTFRGGDGFTAALAWSADGTLVAIGVNRGKDRPREIRVWDAATAAPLRVLRAEMQPITGMAFHPAGGQIVTTGGAADKEGQIKVWDLTTDREPRDLRGHTDIVYSLVFSPDGRRLATASNDRTIKLWDAATFQELFTLRGHTAGVGSVAFSPDGTRIVSGSGDRTAIVWDVNPLEVGTIYRREAAELAESLYKRRLDEAAVIRALRADTTLPARVREAAVVFAERVGDRHVGVNRMARAKEDTNRGLALAASTGSSRFEALEALRRSCNALRHSCSLWEDLIAADPDRAECKKELALALVACGELLESTGQDDEADRAFDRALQLGEDLLRGGRLDRDRMGNDVAIWIVDTIGNRQRSRRRTEQAVRAFELELAIRDELALGYLNEQFIRSSVQQYRRELLQKIRTLRGETGETVEALMLRDKPDDVNRVITRGTALLGAAKLERKVGGTVSAKTRAALNELFQRLERSTVTDPGGFYNLACLYAGLSALGPLDKALQADQDRRGPAESADRAMGALRCAVAAGWHNVEHTKHDPDLDSLRARPDFQRLLLDLAFPADPFAR